IEIKGSSGLDSKEVERMRKEAEAHADEDKRRVELINARNEAEHAIYAIEKLMKDHEAKLQESEKTAIRGAIERTKQAASRDDVSAIRQAVSDLQVAAQGLARHVQGDGAAGGHAAGGGQGGGQKPDDVIDAEFEVKK